MKKNKVYPFAVKVYCIVDDPRNAAVVEWSRDGCSFVILNKNKFEQLVLPVHFKHGNLASFVRQLNSYGFRKVDPERMEWAHESFRRGEKGLLQYIRRNTGIAAAAAPAEQPRPVAEQAVSLIQEWRGLKKEVQQLGREQEQMTVQIEALMYRSHVLDGILQHALSVLDTYVEPPPLYITPLFE